MPPNARERALALVSALDPTDLVPCRILAELLAEVEPAPSQLGRPPHPDGWTTKALAAYYDCGVSTMRGRIEGGEFGLPESPGGPRKAGRRGWLVPHHQVLARDERVQGGARYESVTSPTTMPSGSIVSRPAPSPPLRDPRRRVLSPSAEGRRAVATPSLADARRQRKAGTIR